MCGMLLHGSAEGHGVPRKLIYASIIDAQNVLCYRKDGGRSPGFALQDVSSNHHKLLWSKTTVVVCQESSFTHQLLMHECAMLQKRWGLVPRIRITGCDSKPP